MTRLEWKGWRIVIEARERPNQLTHTATWAPTSVGVFA